MIYAKVYESETPDGELVKTLDWGHIITSPQGLTPEELGYLPFDSVEEAEQYYKLIKIEE